MTRMVRFWRGAAITVLAMAAVSGQQADLEISDARIGNSDHVSFNAAGVPGFNAIQDYTNYDIRVHHTNMDTRDRVQINDIRQAALVTAWFAYQAAQAAEKFPRADAK